MFFISARTLKLTAESFISVPVIQTQLAFEIANGQQTSFMAVTDLIQRRLASTLKWPHYKFTCSETHWHIIQVHMPVVSLIVPLVLTRISIATTFLQTHVRSF